VLSVGSSGQIVGDTQINAGGTLFKRRHRGNVTISGAHWTAMASSARSRWERRAA